MAIRRSGSLAAALCLAVLAACGGGGGGDGGIGGTGTGSTPAVASSDVSFGGITAFGSVWVNGVEFSTTSSNIRFDDRSVTQADLRVGMVVRVDGSIANKTAGTITVDDAVKGRVEQVINANQMVVMGQTIRIDGQTRFENSLVPVAGDLVDVHGFVAGDGLINAGYIERKTTPATPPFAVKGQVKSHDPVGQTFVVGSLLVRYAGAATGDMPSGSWNGVVVSAKGSGCAANPVCGTLTASKVEPNGVRVASAPKAEIEGVVASVTASGFVIGNQVVSTSASTVYQGGTSADIGIGVKVEAEGPIVAGILTASRVSFRDNVKLEGNVVSVDGAGRVSLAGLAGVTVSTNSLTQFKGGISAVGALAAGNHLRITGQIGNGANVVATELELRSATADSRVVLQAPVTGFVTPNSVTMLGVTVATASVSDSNFHDILDQPIGRSAFYAAMKTGVLVKARGSLSGGAVAWDQMELDD